MKYSKRGNKALQRHSDAIVKNQIRLYNSLVAAADEQSKTIVCPGCGHEHIIKIANIKAVLEAFSAGNELMPYIKPKLQAIAPAVLDDEGNLITGSEYLRLIEIARQASTQLLEETNSRIDTENTS